MTPLLQIVFILVVGTLCQIIGWRARLPSILLLLLAGIASGPVLGLLKPDVLLGPLLNPIVELAVAVILFEGGLSLKGTELGKIGKIVLRLITLATAFTWIFLSTLSYFLFQLSFPVSALLGAILVVTGPTVVGPLLRLIRARAPVEPILRWEGILIDPIGVILAVLVAEVCEAGIGFSTPLHIIAGMLIGLVVGGVLGWIGSLILARTIGRHLVPDQFIVPLSLTVLFSLITLSNMLHEQSGLLTATVMGLLVARNRGGWVKTIEDFIGHTQRMFIGVLFVILAARLDPKYLQQFDLKLCLFILVAVLVVRPAAVFFATIGTSLNLREKLAISLLAPRGIVSAALASSLGMSLASSGIPGVENIVPYTFATIIGTVALYGLLSPQLFRMLGVQQSDSQGVLFAGSGTIAIAIAKILKGEGFRTVFVDTNESNIRRIRAAGLESYLGSILSEGVQEEVDLEGIGNLLAFTGNDEANSLATVEFKHIFGAAHVYQIALSQPEGSVISGRIFADKDLTLEKMEVLWSQGYRPALREISGEDSNRADIPEPVAPKPGDDTEFILAEISGDRLFIASQDKLKRAAVPNKQIYFGLKAKT